MPTVPQPYVYPISGIPGGIFDGQKSDRLVDLIHTNLPSATGLAVSSDSVNVTITFDADLSDTDKTTLDGLVPRCSEYFIVTTDNGVTDLGDNALITKVAGVLSSVTVTLKYKNGDGTNSNGHGDTVNVVTPVVVIDKVTGTFDGNGKFQFVVGAIVSSRGTAVLNITSGSLPPRILNITWT